MNQSRRSSDLFNLLESMSADYKEMVDLTHNQNMKIEEIVMQNRRDNLEYLYGHPEVYFVI